MLTLPIVRHIQTSYQKEYCEQQSPHSDPWHVKPKPLPHRALVVTFRVEEGAAEEDRVEDDGVELDLLATEVEPR
jgi:hypothetical protein